MIVEMRKRCDWKRWPQQNNEKREEEKQAEAERKKCGFISLFFVVFPREYHWLINVNMIKYVPDIFLMLFLIYTIFSFLFPRNVVLLQIDFWDVVFILMNRKKCNVQCLTK